MPYIVTTKRQTVGYDVTIGADPIVERGYKVLSRRAVATLEEARNATKSVIRENHSQRQPGYAWLDGWAQPAIDAGSLPESGGTVGPLLDGTVIEVKRVPSGELRRSFDDERRFIVAIDPLIAAYNAAQEVRA